MKYVLLVVCLATSACSAPAPPVASKPLTDDEFLAKLTADQRTKTLKTSAPLLADYDAAGAVAACHAFVLDGLKAPASAQFPDAAATSDLHGGSFRVRGAVDSQNSFGALIRNTYDCTVQWVKGTTWRIDQLELTAR